MATTTIPKISSIPNTQIIDYETTITSSATTAYRVITYELPDVAGYVPVGVVGASTALSTSTPSYNRINSAYLDGNIVTIVVRRPSDSSSKSVHFQILYFTNAPST